MIYYLYFIIYLIEAINASLKSENEIINALSNNTINTVILNISSEINITREIQ